MTTKLPQLLAVNLIKDARSYVECVPVLDQHLHQHGKVLDEMLEEYQHQLGPPHKVPMYFLLGQAIELALKAHLAASGVAKRTLSSKDIRHHIDKLFRMAQDDHGFVPADNRFSDLVQWLAPYHRDHLFRYRKGNGHLTPPCAFSEAAEIILKTIDKIELCVRNQYASASARSRDDVDAQRASASRSSGHVGLRPSPRSHTNLRADARPRPPAGFVPDDA
jgi:hypothetical protein